MQNYNNSPTHNPGHHLRDCAPVTDQSALHNKDSECMNGHCEVILQASNREEFSHHVSKGKWGLKSYLSGGKMSAGNRYF